MQKEAFEQVKSQMGPCGIACASCALGNGTVAETSAKLKEYLRAYSVPSWASIIPGGSDIDFKQLERSLDWIHNSLIGCPGCERGGGSPDCPIRTCSKGRGYAMCSQCADLDACKNFDFLGDDGKQLKAKLKEGKTKAEYLSEALRDLKT